MVELAGIQDKKELQSLWQITFLEDFSVTEKFFNDVFESVVTPVIKVDGEIVSALFLLPCSIGKYKGKCVYCAMTKYSQRGKGYMRELLDFSYNYCKENDFDFLFLVPAEKSLFDYYAKCGFEKFGISRTYTFDGNNPAIKEELDFQCELKFDNTVLEYWKNACVVYGGEVTDFGLICDDEEVIIRNAHIKYADIPESYKKIGTVIKGNIDFGEEYSPAMIKTDKESIKNSTCYIGITLE